MTDLDLVLAIAGTLVTALVVVAMILITPAGVVDVHAEGAGDRGSNLSPTTREEPASVRPGAS